jgi:polyisoprenoid-binding protein YceI
MRRRIVVTACLAALAWVPAAHATQYQVDPDHTSVGFQVRHLFTKVSGRFDKFNGTITYDPAHPEQATVSGTIDASSVNTNNEKRDTHLRSKDFFDVATFPQITFASTSATQVDAAKHSGKMDGKLTIHGVERPVVLDVAFLGTGKDPHGTERAGFSASTTINRKDFGLTWNAPMEAGGVLLGDEITINLDIEAKAVN